MIEITHQSSYPKNVVTSTTLERHQFLGGTDIAAILGLSSYRTPVDVWLEKTQRTQGSADHLVLRFGRYAEDFVAQEYERETGFVTQKPPGIIQHQDHPYLAGSIDRIMIHEGETQMHRLLECKTSHPRNTHLWGEAGTDQVPLNYLVQCLWYLMLTQCEICDLAVLIGNNDFRIYSITRNLAVEELLLKRATHFWQHHVLEDVSPPTQSEADCRALFQTVNNSASLEASPTLMEHIERLKEIQLHRHQEEVEISAIKQIIMNTLKDKDTLTFNNRVVATWKTPKPSLKTDWKLLEKEHPDWVQPYQHLQENSRRLLIKDMPHKD